MRTLHVRQSRKHMATTFAFTIACPEDRQAAALRALEEAHAEVARLERELSEFLSDSPVYRWNEAAAGEKIPFTADGLALWRLSVKMSRQTDGAFNPLAKSVPPASAAENECREEGGCLVKGRAGLRMGFGAIGKGYALDRAREYVERAGFSDYVLSAGGSSVILSGFSAPGQPWTWGWSWKKDGEGESLGVPIVHDSGKPLALGVSGFHEKGRHILSARTGLPVSPWAQSACVSAPSAAEADALSTALFAGHWEVVGDSLPKAVIDGNEVPRWNQRFQSLWGSLGALLFAFLVFFGSAAAFADEELEITEEAVDLSALGVQTFTPYSIERDPLWILLPALSLLLVLLHLKKGPKEKIDLKTVDPGR